MSIAKEVDFEDGVTPVAAAWLDLIQEVLAGYISPNFQIEAASTTQIRVPAGNDDASVGLAIGGQFRRRDSNATATVSGGAGTKSIYATADSSDDLFALEVTDGTPSATLYRKVGEVDWSGTAIQTIRLEWPVGVRQIVEAEDTTNYVPIGGGMVWYYSAAPSGFTLCQGQAISRAANPVLNALASADGYPHGDGDGSTTFNLPDLRRRFPVGKADSGAASTLGDTGGTWDHVHSNPTTGSGGSHSHSQSATGADGGHSHSDTFAVGGETAGDGAGPNPSIVGDGHRHSLSGGVSATGNHTHTNPATSSVGGHTHTQGNTGSANPPYLVVNWAIRLG